MTKRQEYEILVALFLFLIVNHVDMGKYFIIPV